MRKNRLLAVVCAVVMNMSTLIGSIPVFAEETAEPNVQTDMKITGTSPLGEMLADKLTPEQTTLNEQNGCSIYDVKLSDKQAYVQFDTALDCTLLLTLFDDAEEKLLTSVDAEVTSEQTEIILDVPDMPEYCYLHCCLIDTETLAPVSAEYTSALYTKEMQEFLSKTTDDYDEDLVLNLDEDKSKNFLILNEDIVFLHADETTNTVVFDQANRTVTLSNYDENAAKLKAGDTIFLDQGDDGAVFCVDAVEIGADAIVITASEAKLEDLFAYINIDMDAANVLENPEEPSAESAPHAKPPQYLPSGSFSIEQEKMSFGPYSFGNEDSDVSGAATIMLQPTLQCYYSGLHAYAEYDLNIDVLLNKLMLIIKAKKEIPIVTLNLSFGLDYGKDGFSGSNPIDGEIGQKGGLAKIKEYISGIMPSTESISLLKIQFGVNLVLDGNCTVQGSCTVSNSAGLCLDTTNGCKPRTTMPKLTQTNLSADGEIFIGASVDYSVTILELPVPKFLGFGFDIKPIFVVGQKNPMGFQLTVHPSQQYFGGKWQPGDANHLCNCCYEGEVFVKSSTQSSVTSEIIPDFLLPEPKEAIHQNTKICDWHYSKDYKEFALTPCPRHYHKVEIEVKDKVNKPISGVTVSCSSENAARSNERSAVSDKNGIAVLYLNSGVRYLHFEKEGYPAGDGLVRVLGADCDAEFVMDGMETGKIKYFTRQPKNEFVGEPDETGCVWADKVRYQLYDDHAEVAGTIEPAYPGQLLDLSVYALVNGLPVTAVSSSAFNQNGILHTIKLPETMTSIERFAFCNCTNLTSISIPNSVRRINEHAFAGCTSLKSIHIPKSLEYIDTFAFAGSGLTSVTIPGKVQTIYENTFSDCNDLNTVIISEGVEYINKWAFLQCAKLSSVTLPDSLKSIGEYAFENCPCLTSIYFPAGLEYVDISAFSGWTELSSYEVDPANWHYKALDGVLFNGDMTQLVQYPGRNPRTSYTIPDSVTCIGDQAFTDATNLISVTLPDHLKSIGGTAFYSCTDLAEITLPDSLSRIEVSAFSNCKSLTSISIPDGITEIQPNTFAECTSLSSVFIPDSVTTIDTQAFEHCTNLSSISIPNSVNTFGFGVFTGCTGLTSFALPESLKEFGFSMFQGCENLKSVYIPIGVKRIDEEQYFDSTGITDIYYAGSEADWNAIEFNNGWGLIEDYSCPAAIHYNSTASAAAPPVMPKPRFAADETEPTTTTFSTTEAASTTTTTTETEPVETTAITSRDETDLTALTPNSVYNIYAVKSREYGVSAGNLLYFAQAVSDENGAVSVNYDGAMFAVKAKYNLENAEFSVSELAYDGSEKEIFPTVTANGKTLIEGMDYLVSGSYTGTEPGGYSILLEGMGDWFGEKALTYVIEKEMTTDVTTTTTNLTTTSTTPKLTTTTTTSTTSKPTTTVTTSTTPKPTTTTTTSTTSKLTTTVTNSTTPKPTTATTTSATSKPTTTTTTSTAPKPTTTTTTSTTPKQTTTSTTAKPTTTIITTTETTVTTSETKSTEQTYLLGDVNADNEISVEDAQLALTAYVMVMAGMDSGLTDQQLKAADINGDGEVSVEDAQLILLYYVSNTLSHQTVTWDELLGKDKPPVTTTATTASTSKPTSTVTTATTSKK